MDELLKILNYDMSEYIIKITIGSIRQECRELYTKYQQEKLKLPPEPTSGKMYNIWLNQMVNYTSKIKPLESEIKWYYDQIMTCRDFNMLNSHLYLDFKDIMNEWYEIKNTLIF